ncbi:MAG: tRNA lysidine(34) synthetase TilS [Clostridia bacterium]|nr:tRNA lysidine(34) synthetase TilS [Clostridia bacterium]MDY4083899.1 tRNA lysidine(34) synthetase TilS [Eubacteriales bacterium]
MQKLLSLARKAISDYKMIEDGDKIAVGLSGGKDSITLLAVLAAYKKFAPEKFDLIAINIDMGFEDIDKNQVQATKDFCESVGVPLIIEKTDIAAIIFDERKEKSPCSLCSKMRRGALNNVAIDHGCNKLALGHHADDVIETMMLSLLYEGRFSTFMPVSYMDKSKITLIRPLVYIEEKQINWTAKRLGLPVIFNPCPRDKHTKREDVKQLIRNLDEQFVDSKKHIMSAIFNPERNSLWDKAKPNGD